MTEQTMELEKQEDVAPVERETVQPRRTIKPRIDVFESGDTIMLVADMPGVKESDISITLEKDRLTLEGPIEDRAPEGYRAVYSEFCFGTYVRSFVLSDEIDRENIEANFKNGVLRLTLPKVEKATPRTIAVSAG